MSAVEPRLSLLYHLHLSEEEKFAHPEWQKGANELCRQNTQYVKDNYRPGDYILVEKNAAEIPTSCHELPGLDPAKYAVRGWDDPAAVERCAGVAAIQKVGSRVFGNLLNTKPTEIEQLVRFNQENQDPNLPLERYRQEQKGLDQSHPRYADLLKTVGYFRHKSLPYARMKYVVATWQERQEGLTQQICTYAAPRLANHVFVILGRLHVEGFDYQGSHYAGLPLATLGIPYRLVHHVAAQQTAG